MFDESEPNEDLGGGGGSIAVSGVMVFMVFKGVGGFDIGSGKAC